jgi:probable F420-dependent oxidoreductase
VKAGVTIFPTDYAMPLAELAVAAEARGLESLWVAEHSHIPASRKSPYPGGGELPKMYFDTLDPFVALASAASVTSRIKLATGICLVVERDPIHTAKEVASLDRVSGGRFLFGVGAGWNAEEMAAHGTTDFAGRFKLLRERVELMKALWTQKEASYQGELVQLEPSFMWPKPVQKPHPPIHVGGAFPGGARRAVRYGSGWIPIGGLRDRLEENVPAFRRMAEEAGRDPAALEVSVYGAAPREKAMARYESLGVDRVVFALPPAPRDELLPILDQCAELARKVG